MNRPSFYTSFFELTRETLQLYRDHLQKLLSISLLVKILIPFFIGFLLLPLLPKEATPTPTAQQSLLLFSMLLGWMLSLLGQALILPLVAGIGDVNTSFKMGFSQYAQALWTGLTYLLLTVGLLGCFVIPGILFAIRCGLFMPTLMLEGKAGIQGLTRSYQLTREHFLWMLRQLSLLIAGLMLVSMLLYTLHATFLSLLVDVLALPFYAIFLYLLYQKTKVWQPTHTITPSETSFPILRFLLGSAVGYLILFEFLRVPPLVLYRNLFLR